MQKANCMTCEILTNFGKKIQSKVTNIGDYSFGQKENISLSA